MSVTSCKPVAAIFVQSLLRRHGLATAGPFGLNFGKTGAMGDMRLNPRLPVVDDASGKSSTGKREDGPMKDDGTA
jgi:hypothetical protein